MGASEQGFQAFPGSVMRKMVVVRSLPFGSTATTEGILSDDVN